MLETTIEHRPFFLSALAAAAVAEAHLSCQTTEQWQENRCRTIDWKDDDDEEEKESKEINVL